MEQSPSWEGNWFLASQEIPPILWNTNDFLLPHSPELASRPYSEPDQSSLSHVSSVV